MNYVHMNIIDYSRPFDKHFFAPTTHGTLRFRPIPPQFEPVENASFAGLHSGTFLAGALSELLLWQK